MYSSNYQFFLTYIHNQNNSYFFSKYNNNCQNIDMNLFNCFLNRILLILQFKPLINMKYFLLIPLLLILNACYKGKSVDLIIHNARIHVLNDKLEMAEAIAIKDGEIVEDRKSTRLNSSHVRISYAVFCLK